MNDLRKAAIIIMCLPDELGSSLLSKLKPCQVEAVCIELARLEALTPQEQEDVIIDFAEMNPMALGRSSGSLDLASSLVEQALGKNANETLDNLRQTIEGTPFGFLKKADPQNLMTFLADEHPQTIALILSHLPPAFGAEVIGNLDPEKQTSVIRRIANMGQTNPEVIDQVEEGLGLRMQSMMTQAFQNAGGVSNVAEILNVTDRATERSLMETLGEDDPNLVDEIRRLMFVFEDLAKLGNDDVQAVLKNVETSQWAMALKGASQELKEKVLGNMSKRAAQTLVEEMEYLGAVKISDVETVQQEIVDLVRKLEEMGEITGAAGDEEEAYVE